jgi:hypothetical protein
MISHYFKLLLIKFFKNVRLKEFNRSRPILQSFFEMLNVQNCNTYALLYNNNVNVKNLPLEYCKIVFRIDRFFSIKTELINSISNQIKNLISI